MVTYADLIQFCLLIVALIGLCYTIFGGRKQPPLLAIVTAARQGCKFSIWGRPCVSGFPLFYLQYSILQKCFQEQIKIQKRQLQESETTAIISTSMPRVRTRYGNLIFPLCWMVAGFSTVRNLINPLTPHSCGIFLSNFFDFYVVCVVFL